MGFRPFFMSEITYRIGRGDWEQGQIERARASIYISCISQTFIIFQSATISDKTYLIVRACDISQNFCMIDNL